MEGSRTKVENFIGGSFEPISSGKYLVSYEPARGKSWAEIADSDKDEIDRAVQAACHAFPTWAATSVEERARLLMKVADLLQSRIHLFAVAESRDQGKPLRTATEVEIPRAVINFRHFAATFPNMLDVSNVHPEENILNYTTRNPVGVVGLISPWNLPLYLLTFKMAPALMAGNTVVCKPSEMTSVTAWMLCSLFNEAGIPPGVVNMVFGTGARAGIALAEHPLVRLISFTGSTATGSLIQQRAAPHFKKLSLELGGKNAAIIFEDADIERCIAETVR